MTGVPGQHAGRPCSKDRDVVMDATVRFHGDAQGDQDPDFPPMVLVQGCMVRVGANADVENSAFDSGNRIVARGGLEIEDGASFTCDGCANTARIRSDENPFTNDGDFDPALKVTVHENLPSCPNCIDPASGDREFCDDGFDCTSDACTDGECVAVPDDAGCDDGAFCNGTATCDVSEGCVAGEPVDCSHLDDGCFVGICHEETEACVAEPADGLGCEDGDECTVEDACSAGV